MGNLLTPPLLPYFVYTITIAVAATFVMLRRRGVTGAAFFGVEVLAAAGCAAALLSVTSGPLFIDYTKAYDHAGRAIILDPATLYDCARAQCFVNFPAVALLFVPFAQLDPHVGALAFSAVGAAAILLAMRHLAGRPPAHVVIWLVLLNGPLLYSLRIGNTTHILLIVLLVAFDRLADGRQALAGALMAVAAMIKPPLAIFLPYLLLRRYDGAAAAMFTVAAATLALSIGLYGLELHEQWFREVILGQGSAPLAAYNVQSVNGFLARLTTRGHLRDWYPLSVGPSFRMVSVLMTAGLLLASAMACRRAGRPRSAAAWYAELSIVLCVGLITAPISWSHYSALLLIPAVAFTSGRLPLCSLRMRAALGTAIVLVSAPVVVPLFSGRIASALVERVLLSHYFYGTLILLGVLIAVRLSTATTESDAPHRGLP